MLPSEMLRQNVAFRGCPGLLGLGAAHPGAGE